MNAEQELKLQSFLDGELPEAEAREVAAWLARDADAKALHSELRHTRQALKQSEPNALLPESREFFWSKIQRDIARLEPTPAATPAVSPFRWLRRLLVPTGSLAALALAVLVAGGQFGWFSGRLAPATETAMANASTFTYHDEANGTTLVWVSFPAETEIAQPAAN